MYNHNEIAALAVEKHRAQQDPAELAHLLDMAVISHDVYPGRASGVALELGHAAGGTAWALHAVGFQVISVDPDPGCPEAKPGNVLIRGHSQDVYKLVVAALAGRYLDLLLIDGDHSRAAALADWTTYHSLVRPDGLVALHDSERQPGVQALVTQLRDHQVPVITVQASPGDSPGYAFYRN